MDPRGFNLELSILGLQMLHSMLDWPEQIKLHPQDVFEGLHRASFDAQNPWVRGGFLRANQPANVLGYRPDLDERANPQDAR